MISVEHEDDVTIVGVFGEFELADYRRFEDAVIAQLKQRGRLSLLMDLRDMVGLTVDVALEDIRFTRAHADAIGRVAILSERSSVAWTALLSQLFVDTEIRVFDGEPAARAWLSGEPDTGSVTGD